MFAPTLIQEHLKRDPFLGHLFVFGGKNASLLKILFCVSPRSRPADQSGDLTRACVCRNSLATYPLNWLSWYKAALWRQACQILVRLQCLNQRKPWERPRYR